jgi:hypothetical protein
MINGPITLVVVMVTAVKERGPRLKDCNSMDLQNDPNALAVIKKPIPLKVEFAKENGTISTKEGEQPFKAGDAIMTGTQGEKWPIPANNFKETYEVVDAAKGLYAKKNIEVLAVQMNQGFTVNVSWSEKPLVGKAGDWLVQYGKGDFGIVDRQIFKETYDVVGKLPEVSMSTFSNKDSIAGKAKILNGLSEVYMNAYHNSEHWPLYGNGPGQEKIPVSWGKQLALDVLSDPKGGAVFVAQDKNGEVIGSLIAVNFSSVMDSHSPAVQAAIDMLKAQFGEDTLRKMWYIVDVTVKPDTQKAKHAKGSIRLGVQQMGVGTELFNQFEAFIKQKGAIGFLDWTSSENAPMRQGMYPKMGITELPGGHPGIEANVERGNKVKDPRWYEEGEKDARYAYKTYSLGVSNLEGSL